MKPPTPPSNPQTSADALRHPINWIISAQTQMRAARLLNDKLQARFAGDGFTPDENRPGAGTVDDFFIVDMDLFKPIYMLAGLSIEMAFKAVIVRQEPNCIDASGLADWQKRGKGGHSLTELAVRSKVPNLDFELLQNIEPFITWKGRYPASDLKAFYEPPSWINFAGGHTSDVLDSVEKMLNAARARAMAKAS